MSSIAEQFGREDWTRYTPKQKARRFGTFAACAIVIMWALSSIEVIWAWVWDSPEQMGDLFGRMYPPDISNLGQIIRILIETVNIATIATAIAVFLSLPVAYIAAQNTTPNAATLWLGRLILVTSRSVNTIIWALLFVAIFGPGVLAGIIKDAKAHLAR